MEVHVLDNYSRPYKLIDEFESCIWTERYTEPGDFKLVLPATQENIGAFYPGLTLVQCNVSPETMVVETREVADGLVTVTGRTIEIFLENHSVPMVLPGDALTITDTPGRIITRLTQVVLDYVANYNYDFGGQGTFLGYVKMGVQVEDDVIDPFIGTVREFTEVIPAGTSLYSQVVALAQKYNIGLSMTNPPKLENYGSLRGSDFLFNTYRGVDRSSGQTERERLLFSPALDNFQGVKEFKSEVDALNLIHVYPSDDLRVRYERDYPPPNRGFIPASRETYGSTPLGWDVKRKDLIVEGITDEQIGARGDGQPTLVRLMRQMGANELNEHGPTYTVDGEVIPQEHVKYRRDYNLGDIVELDAFVDIFDGSTATATVSEYIYADDSLGERAYPTVVVTKRPIGHQLVSTKMGTE